MQVSHETVALDYSEDNTHTSTFKVPKWVMFAGVLIPQVVDGAVGIEISIDGGGNYHPLADPADGADVEIVASAADPAWIDFSDFLRFIHPNCLVRFVTAGTQSADTTWDLLFKG